MRARTNTFATAARAVVAYWDYMESVDVDDPRTIAEFYAELQKRIDALRDHLPFLTEGTTP